MLSPVINTVNGMLTDALNEVFQLDKYSTTLDNLMIGKLPEDPKWLTSVRYRVDLLGEVGARWRDERPDIWAPILTQFIDYSTTVASIADMQKSGKVKNDEWVKFLREMLVPGLDQAMAVAKTSNDKFESIYTQYKDIQPLLEESIQQGWSELAEEEKQMIKIAEALTHLQDTVASLEDSITGDVISSGKSVISTTVTTVYKVVTEAGVSFSYLSMATSAFTVGKLYYDVITKTDEAVDALKKIAALQVAASEAAQAAAGTKSVLQILYNLEKSFLAIKDTLPAIIAMWNSEKEKVQAVIEALDSGADPATYFELTTLPTASANWNAITDYVQRIVEFSFSFGPAVVLDVSSGTITTTE